MKRLGSSTATCESFLMTALRGELTCLRSVQQFLDTDLMGEAETEKILHGSAAHEHVKRLGADGSSKELAERSDVVRVLEAAQTLH